MKLAWLTDIHLDFLNKESQYIFYQNIASSECDALLVTGDIAVAGTVVSILEEMVDAINKPIYFVLGNHDFYGNRIDTVKNSMIELMQHKPLLYWLPKAGLQMLSPQVMLLGQDGWADGRLGDYQQSRVSLHDSRMIVDLFHEKILGKNKLLEKMQQLADDDAKALQQNLQKAISNHPKKIIVLTHVPPFRETAMYEGKISSDDYLPYFSSKATGDVLVEAATQNPTIEFLVLCGHTHYKCVYQALSNLKVQVGEAEYGNPIIQEIISIDK